MRVTVDPQDPDFIGARNAGRYSVFLNGKPLDCVVEASTDRGYAVVLMKDDAGRFDIDRKKNEIRKHRAVGRVEIIDALDVPGSEWRKLRGLD